MSKTKTLFTTMALLVLLGSMAVVAQNFTEIKLFTTPPDFAREGGKNEAAGSILLNSSAMEALRADGAMIMLHFSVPLAADIDATTQSDDATEVTVTGDDDAVVTGMAEDDDDNDGNGTIMINPGNQAGLNLLIEGVKLDVSGAEGAVTVTLKVTAGEGDFIRIEGPSSAMVIEDIKVGVAVSVTAETVRTRGTDADGVPVSLTLKESFKGAFMTGNMVTVDFSGIPGGATLTAKVTSNPVANAAADPPVAIDEDSLYATVSAVKNGSATVTLGGNDGMRDRPGPASVTLGLALIADPNKKKTKVSFPLNRGSIMAEATFTDPTGTVDNFVDAFTDLVTVFNIRPAQCELLFPVVTVVPASESNMWSWDTAISVANPAYASEMADGVLTFTFYGQDTEPAEFITSQGSPGTGLSLDGTLAAGGTYQVQASQILAEFPDWGTRFVGHVHLLADYTNCSGLGWVTNYNMGVTGGVNQAYTATVIIADTGADKNQ